MNNVYEQVLFNELDELLENAGDDFTEEELLTILDEVYGE